MAASAQDRVFESAAELFGLLSAPRRLQIVCVLCEGEKNVGELMAHLGASQSNVSQHLGILYRGGVLGRRRMGAQVYYRITSQRVWQLREAFCGPQAVQQAVV
jgi:DNA-binding transcriptional ArsR family regulator